MKKVINIGLTAFMLFAICACGGKESGEVQISVSCADEAFLEKYKEYDSFVKDEAYAQKITFISNIPVKDFRWLSIGLSDNPDTTVYEVIGELYKLNELHPKKPLVVSWVEAGIMSAFGFSYRDKDGQNKYFMGRVGNYGRDPEEYNGPCYIIQQFFPKEAKEPEQSQSEQNQLNPSQETYNA